MIKLPRFALLFVFSLCLTVSVCAQQQLSDNARISLITILPGEAPEELFGHSAVRVQDPGQDLDISFNYGTFQFDSFFLPKFIYGELNYFLSVAQFSRAVEHYRQRNRPVIEQVLNLSNDQKQALFEFLTVNAREENRYYRYDFLFDNCSTRIRDAVKAALDGDIQFGPEPDPELSFRRLISLYLADKPFLNFGIDLLLGSRVDRIAEPEETMFLPDYLMEAFEHANVHIHGEVVPLVAATDQILHIDGYNSSNSSPPRAVILTWFLFLTGAAVTYFNYRNNQIYQRWLDLPLFAVSGLIGLLITFLWFISLHDVTVNNLNLLWALPSHLILLPFVWKHSKPGRKLAVYLYAASAAVIVLIAGWFLWTQYLHPAALPVMLLITIRSSWIASADRRTDQSK